MPLYPLGISRGRDVPSVPRQAGGSVDMRWSLAGDLACAYIDAPHRAVPPMLHATALDAIHRRICVLPVRFGVALRDEAEIRALLQDRRNELLEHLSRLDSTCEMGLRIASQELPGTQAGIECRPNCRRADERLEQDGWTVQQLVERLQGYYRQWRKLQASPSHPIRLAFLVERDRVTAFRSRLQGTCCPGQPWRCAILGPWPPYSFV